MTVSVIQTFGLVLPFLLGYGLKKTKLVSPADGQALLRLLFLVGLPALVFTAIYSADIMTASASLALVPLLILGTSILVILLAHKSKYLASIDTSTQYIALASTLLLNTAFLVPFVEQFYGVDGLARLLIIDTVNGILVVSLAYSALRKFLGKQISLKHIMYNVSASLPLWALLLAILYRTNDWVISSTAETILSAVASIVPLLILITFGILFTLELRQWKTTASVIITRYTISLLAGVAFVALLGLKGLDAQITILAALAPTGFNAILFAKQEKLSTVQAKSYVSVSILLSFLVIPAGAVLLQSMYA